MVVPVAQLRMPSINFAELETEKEPRCFRRKTTRERICRVKKNSAGKLSGLMDVNLGTEPLKNVAEKKRITWTAAEEKVHPETSECVGEELLLDQRTERRGKTEAL